MMMLVTLIMYIVAASLFFLKITLVYSVPPDECFANFRWDDCGQPPKPVMYYWKPGSRCEVGLWRGCLPNVNMFADEFECISTCIFGARAAPRDFHSQNAMDFESTESNEVINTAIDDENSTVTATDDTGTLTDVTGHSENSTDQVTTHDVTNDVTGGGTNAVTTAAGDHTGAGQETTAAQADEKATTAHE